MAVVQMFQSPLCRNQALQCLSAQCLVSVQVTASKQTELPMYKRILHFIHLLDAEQLLTTFMLT